MHRFCLISAISMLAASQFVVVGCQSSASRNDQLEAFGKKIDEDIRRDNDPLCAVPRLKKYAVEKLEDLTDAEVDFINANAPEITSNYDQSMYAFVWKLEAHRLIEVLTSAAPFEPVAVYRVSRVYFP